MIMMDFQCTNEDCKHCFESLLDHKEEQEDMTCPLCGEKAERMITGLKAKHISWSQWRAGE